MEQLSESVRKTLLKRLFFLLKKMSIEDQRKELVWEYSGERTSSTKYLRKYEFERLVEDLQNQYDDMNRKERNAADRMRKKFFHYAHLLGWETKPGELDYDRINGWLKKYGYLHKGINEYSIEELPRLISQIQQLYIKRTK